MSSEPGESIYKPPQSLILPGILSRLSFEFLDQNKRQAILGDEVADMERLNPGLNKDYLRPAEDMLARENGKEIAEFYREGVFIAFRALRLSNPELPRLKNGTVKLIFKFLSPHGLETVFQDVDKAKEAERQKLLHLEPGLTQLIDRIYEGVSMDTCYSAYIGAGHLVSAYAEELHTPAS